MKQENEIKTKKTLAVTQIFVLVVATFAFVWLVAGTLPSVGGGVTSSSSASSEKVSCKSQGGNCLNQANWDCIEFGRPAWTTSLSCEEGKVCCMGEPISKNTGASTNEIGEQYEPSIEELAENQVHTDEKGKDDFWSWYYKARVAGGILGGGEDDTSGTWDFVDEYSDKYDEYLNDNLNDNSGPRAAPLGSLSGALGVEGGWGIALDSLGALGAATAGYFIGSAIDPNSNVAKGAGSALGAASYILLFTSWAPWIAIPVAAGLFLLNILFGKEIKEQGQVTFQCNLWQPVAGGENCELCNQQEIPCSEYQCRSLGKACEFVQSDNETGEPFCYWNNRNDIDPPTINPNLDLLTAGYNYVPDGQLFPQDNGVKIVPEDGGCLSPYESIQFGIWVNKDAINNKPATCKWATQSTPDYDSMPYYFSGSTYPKVNHSEIIKVPDLTPTATGQEQDINVFVRCESLNGISNTGEFIFNMCVDPEPDTTPPIIVDTSTKSGARVPYGTTTYPLEIYVNEPANCKWDFNPNVKYEEMEQNFTCTNNVRKINSQILYTCETELTGVVANTKESENRYYFKCQDKSEDKNTNTEDQPVEGFLLRGSEPLVIDEVSPNATTIRGATEYINVTLEVKTVGGSEDGVSVCEYSSTGAAGSYSLFDETDSYYHKAEIRRSEGEHTIYVRCTDSGLNVDTESTTFTVDTDLFNPLISRAYYEEGYMKLITSEDASCVYTNFDCTYAFEDGLEFTTYDNKEHFTPWNTEVDLYVKCRDELGNKPAVDQCNIVVRATNEAA